MNVPTKSPDLSLLADDYEIVGELSMRDDGQTFIATRKDSASKRRGDQTGVVITVYTSPPDDEGNALSHLAADTKTLARSAHRRLIPVLEGRWLGPHHFAVVTERVGDESLAQRLESGDTFSNPRTAAILREVNGLLEWAREQQIIHRGITADRVFLEAKTDRVRVSFVLEKKERVQRYSAADLDARTIARLTVAMLTGQSDGLSTSKTPLAELRPDLPDQLIERTALALDEKTTGTDVPAYLALVGMADPLAAGETEAERVREEVREEQRVEREKLANERAAFELDMANQREQFSREREALLHTVAAERDQLQRAVADERVELQRIVASERAEMQRLVSNERDALKSAVADERAALVAKREALERAAEERLAAVERTATEDRARIVALRGEIQRAGELEVEAKREAALDEITDTESTLDAPALEIPLFVPPQLVPLSELAFDDDTRITEAEELAFEPSELLNAPTPFAAPPELLAVTAPAALPDSPPPVSAPEDAGRGRRRWLIGGAVIGTVVIIAISAVALGRTQARSRPQASPVASAPRVAPPVMAAPAPLVPLPAVRLQGVFDSTSTQSAPVVDSARASAPQPVVRRTPRAAVTRDTTARANTAATDSLPLFQEVPRVRADSGSRPDTTGRPPT